MGRCLRVPLVVLVLAAAAPAAAGAATRSICIGLATGAAGARVDLPITLDDGNGVAGLQIDVRYDAARLAPAGVRLGPDTAATGVWSVDSAARGPGLMTVIAFSNPPAGLSAGFKYVVVVSFDVSPAAAVQDLPLPLGNCVLGDVNGLPIACDVCFQPGVETAAARTAVSIVDDGAAYSPARLVVEQGDWVLWENTGASRRHTTTSGTRDPVSLACAAEGLWRGDLLPGGQFARQFLEPPSSLLPYFCEPDCALGQTGEVLVTGPIHLTVGDVTGPSRLTWQGGSGLYVVFRSDGPAFVGPATRSFTPDGGDAGTSLVDTELPAGGTAFFYLVVNKP